MRVGVRRKSVAADKVDRENELHLTCFGLGHQVGYDLGTFRIKEAAADFHATENFLERVGHAAPDNDGVSFLDEVGDERDFVRDLRAAENGEQRTLGMFEHGREGIKFLFHQEAGGFLREVNPDHRGMRAVRRAEGIVDVNIAELAQTGAEGGDFGGVGFDR